jgi:hypothetical protein
MSRPPMSSPSPRSLKRDRGQGHRVLSAPLAGEMAERSKALDWNSSNILTGVRGFESHSLRHTYETAHPSAMVARTGFSATTSRKSRQARKGAAVAAMSGAGAELVRAISPMS